MAGDSQWHTAALSPPRAAEAAAVAPRIDAAPAPPVGATPQIVGFPGLHGLRGGLAMWVVIYHAMPSILGARGLGHYGYLAVDVFFVMSGFILMHTHGRDFTRLSIGRVLRFYELRYWRTFPAFAASMLVALAISIGVIGYTPTLGQLTRAVTLFDTWNVKAIAHQINTPIWSLRAEWVGYLAMPIVFFATRRLRAGAGLVAAALFVMLAQIVAMQAGGFPPTAFEGAGALIRMAGGCTLGCLLWVVRDQPILRRLRGDGAFALLVVAAVLATHWSALYAVPFLALLTLPAAYPGRLGSQLLTSRPALFLGRISFSLYIVHMPVMCAFIALQMRGAISSPVASALTIAVAMLSAWLICTLVEEPARRIGRRAPSLTGLFRAD